MALCECGCGEDAGLRTGNFLKGMPKKFVNASHSLRKTHCLNGHPLTLENKNGEGECILCTRMRAAEWRARNPEKVRDRQLKTAAKPGYAKKARERSRRQRKEDPKTVKATRLWYRYKMTMESFQGLLAEQDNKCFICRMLFGKIQREMPCVDHNHTCCPGDKSCGECIRGILCLHCNHMLGSAKDNPEVLLRAIEYLKKYERTQDVRSEAANCAS